MTGRPRHTKPDAIQGQLIADLREDGFVVMDLHDLGGEVLDLLVCRDGKCLPVEAKAPGSEKIFTDGEMKIIAKLLAVGVVPIVATCKADVLKRWGPLYVRIEESSARVEK